MWISVLVVWINCETRVEKCHKGVTNDSELHAFSSNVSQDGHNYMSIYDRYCAKYHRKMEQNFPHEIANISKSVPLTSRTAIM